MQGADQVEFYCSADRFSQPDALIPENHPLPEATHQSANVAPQTNQLRQVLRTFTNGSKDDSPEISPATADTGKLLA